MPPQDPAERLQAIEDREQGYVASPPATRLQAIEARETGKTEVPPARGQVDVLSSGPPGTAAAQGAIPEAAAPSMGSRIVRAAEIASRGIMGAEAGVRAVAPVVRGALSTPGTIGANVGEAVGQAVGSRLLPGAGTAVVGALGAGAGLTAETLLRTGQLPTLKQVGTEMGLSVLPEAAESTVRGVGRQILRRLPGGQRIRFDEAARQARQLVGDVFQPQTRQQVGRAYDLVRQSGLRVDVGVVGQEVRRLTPGKFDDLLSEIRLLDRRYATGGRYEQLIEALRNPGAGRPRLTGYDISDLDQLSSGLRIRRQALGTHESRVLLGDLRDAVDDAIFTGLARGRVPRGQTPEVLREARAQWARVRAGEDLHQLVERSITSTPDLAMNSFNLRQMVDGLRRGQSEIQRSVNRALDLTPGAREAYEQGLETLARNYRNIEFPLTGVTGLRRFAVVDFIAQGLSAIMLSPLGQQVFRQVVVAGRGQASLNGIALAANVARRELGLMPLTIPREEGTTGPTPVQGAGTATSLPPSAPFPAQTARPAQ